MLLSHGSWPWRRIGIGGSLARVEYKVGNQGPYFYDDEENYSNDSVGGATFSPYGMGGVVTEDGARLEDLPPARDKVDAVETGLDNLPAPPGTPSLADIQAEQGKVDALEGRATTLEDQTFTDATFTTPTADAGASGLHGSFVMDVFRSGPAAGRILLANGSNLYLQNAVNSSSWTVVGTTGGRMDPGFVKISPDQSRIAMGFGLNAPFVVFNSSNVTGGGSPFVIHTGTSPGTGVSQCFQVHYDAAWMSDNRHLVVAAGNWPTATFEGGAALQDANALVDSGPVIMSTTSFQFASGGITVDADNNLYMGAGIANASPAPQERGNIRVFPASTWWNGAGNAPTQISWSSGRLVAEEVLTAAHLSFDELGNLLVGGGLSRLGESDLGAVAIIHADVIARVLGTPQGSAVNKSLTSEYRTYAGGGTGAFSWAVTPISPGRTLMVMNNSRVDGSNVVSWLIGDTGSIRRYNP